MREIFAFVALLALWVVPAIATEHCDHGTGVDLHAAHVALSDDNGERQRHNHSINAVTEEIPNGDTSGKPACQHNLGEACQCKTGVALSCGMEGCCIKADGPLSTGLNDRLPTNDDHALSIQAAAPGENGRTAISAIRRIFLPRELTGPDPRPPSA